MIYQSLKMALKSISGNKMRSFLTILGVVIGVVAIVVLVAIAQGANASVVSRIESMGTNLISVNIRARWQNPITLDDLRDLSQVSGIAYVAPTVNVSGTVKAGVTTYDDGTIQGTTPGYEEIRNYDVQSGRFLRDPDIDNRSFVAVLGTEAATEMFGTESVVGENFSLNGYTFTVVGVLKEMGSTIAGSGDNLILIPFTLAERLFSQRGISNFYVSAASSQEVSAAQEAVTNYLKTVFSTSSQYSVYNQTEMLSTLNETTATLTLMLGGIAAISLLVGGIGIMNIMLVSVSERTREIGIRKAIGAARGNILTQFLIEALVVSLMGGLLGLAIATAACYFLAPILSMTLTISPMVSMIAIGFSVFIGVVFGLYPANKASKLRPIEALRYEG
jgi:putative ABC transport system permease protein